VPAVKRAAFIAILCAAVAAPPVTAFFEPHSVRGSLDGDPAAEEARTVRVLNPLDPADDLIASTEVHISDTCETGTTDVRIAGPEESLGFLKLYDADTRPGREVFVDLRSGATGRGGQTRLVAWRPAPGACGQPRILFRYDADRPTRRPRGTSSASNFALVVKEIDRRFKGRELRLSEGFVKKDEAYCCPSVQKYTYLRYHAGRDRYVRYKTRILRRKTG
jgi:hypothetical protein